MQTSVFNLMYYKSLKQVHDSIWTPTNILSILKTNSWYHNGYFTIDLKYGENKTFYYMPHGESLVKNLYPVVNASLLHRDPRLAVLFLSVHKVSM